jgi:hypothetical protein
MVSIGPRYSDDRYSLPSTGYWLLATYFVVCPPSRVYHVAMMWSAPLGSYGP